MRRIALLLTALLAMPLFTAGPVHAQDDWEVEHDPFDKKVIGKYKAILAKNPHDGGALAKLLSMYRRYRTVDLLESEYKKLLDKNPSSFSALVVMGYLRKTGGDEAGALAYFEKAAAATSKDDPALLVELGDLYRNAGKTTEAKTALDKALASTTSKPVKKKALRALADLALAGNDIEAAKKYFDQYIALDPKNVQLKIELADALLQAGKHDEAIAIYREAETAKKGDASRRVEIVIRIGQALEGKGADDEAVTEYRRALSLVPRGHFVEGEVTLRIIDIYRRKQDLPKLLAYYEKEWSVKSRGHFEWATLASLYEETGSGDKAIDAYKKAVAKASWELETQRKLIQLLENVGREDEAIKQYEAVVKVAPSEAHFQTELAARYWKRGEEKKALATLKKLDQSFPTDPGVQSSLADLYQNWGKDALALAAYEKLAKLEPDDPGHLQILGEQYWNKGDKANHDKALAIWKRIAAGKNPGAAAYAKLGDVLAEHGMHVDALAHYAKALKLEPKNFELYKGRAAIYESQKQWAEAMKDWESGMALLGDKPADRTLRRESRRHIVTLLTRWGGKEADYRNKWIRDFKKTPADLDAGYFLVEYYDRRPQPGEPRATLEKLRTLAPEDQDVVSDLVKAYRDAHEYDKAVALLLELEVMAPARKREIYTTIAEIRTEQGKHDDEAIEWSKKAIEITNSKDPVAWEHLAERYREMQRSPEAIAAYEKSLELDRSNYKATFALAQLYVDDGQPSRAADLYRRILKESTDDETLLKAGKEAIGLEESTLTLGELEKVISPLAFQMAYKPVYRKILVDLYIRYVRYLASELRHGDTATRKKVRAELDRLGQHGLKPLLEALNDDKDVNQQRGAVEVLGHLGNPGAAAPLVRIALTEPKSDDPARKIGTLQQSLDWQVRVDALVAAGRLGDPGVIASVIKLVKHDEVAMREAAIFTIGRAGKDKRAVAPLIAALGDRRESVQALACIGLSGVDDSKGVAAMIDVVEDGKRHDLARAACAWGLGVRKAKTALPALSTALADNRGEAQRLAAWAIAQIGDKKALPDLFRAYFTRDDAARPVLGWAIAHLAGTAPAAPTTADLTAFPVSATGTYHTVTGISHLPGDLPAVEDMTAAIAGNEAAIAEGIRDALGQHRDMVLGMLADLDDRAGGLSLGKLIPDGTQVDTKLTASLDVIAKAIAKDVTAHLGDQDAKVRAHAISVAAKIDADGLTDAIVKALGDDASLVRQAAMRAVVTVARRDGEAPQALRTALAKSVTEGEWQDRSEAVRSLQALGAGADTQALIGALTDENAWVREAAGDALGALKARSAVDALLVATQDFTWNVRRAAAAALVAIGDSRAKARLAELAKDDDVAEVRAAAGGK
jgi:tetratricopeptide (TPR) repeat protein